MKQAKLKTLPFMIAVVSMCGFLLVPFAHATPVATLNELIETARDGQNGYAAAAEAVKDAKLKDLFSSLREQRAKFVDDLQKKVQELGGTPEDSGTLGAKLHRGWIDLKAAISKGDERSILAETEKGDAVAVKVYEDALRNPDLPENVRSLVEKQAAEVKSAYEKIRQLENKEMAENEQDWENKKEELQTEIEDWKNDVAREGEEHKDIDEAKDTASKMARKAENKIEE